MEKIKGMVFSIAKKPTTPGFFWLAYGDGTATIAEVFSQTICRKKGTPIIEKLFYWEHGNGEPIEVDKCPTPFWGDEIRANFFTDIRAR